MEVNNVNIALKFWFLVWDRFIIAVDILGHINLKRILWRATINIKTYARYFMNTIAVRQKIIKNFKRMF